MKALQFLLDGIWCIFKGSWGGAGTNHDFWNVSRLGGRRTRIKDPYVCIWSLGLLNYAAPLGAVL